MLFRRDGFRAETEQHHQGLGQVGEAQLRGDRRTAAAAHTVVHERGAGRGGRRNGQRREEVQAAADGETVSVQAQERAGVQAAHQQVGGARHRVLHVRGHQRHRENQLHRHTDGQSQPVQ